MSSKNIVVMPAFSEDKSYQSFYYNSVKSWQDWCKKNGVEFYVVTEPVFKFLDVPPQMQKMWIMDILIDNGIKFDQIAQVDYDTFPLPHCPNFFEQTNNNFTAVLDNGFGPQINRSIRMCKNNWYNGIKVDWDTYFNSGFIVYNKSHLSVFKEIQNFYFAKKDEWCRVNRSPDLTDDQTLLNFELRKQKFDITFLGRSYNVLDWHCRNFFASYVDEMGREINAKVNIKDCINIFHLTGDVDFRNQASDFLVREFLPSSQSK